MSNKKNISDEQNNKLNNLEKKLDLKIKKEDTDYVKTPEYLSKERIIINPQTKDNNFLMDAITLSLFCKSIGKNNTRPINIRKFSDTINWEDINFQPTGEDYIQFEKNNKDMKLNVLELNDNQIYDYVYRSKHDKRKNEVNILLLQKKHYIYIKNLICILNYSEKLPESE